MADLQSALVARLIADAGVAALVGDRLYWSKVPQGTAMPYVRMQTVSDPRPQNLQGYDGARTVRVQVDVFARSHGNARAASEAIVAAVALPATFAGVRFGRCAAQGPRDLGEDDTPEGFIHRLSTDLFAEFAIA